MIDAGGGPSERASSGRSESAERVEDLVVVLKNGCDERKTKMARYSKDFQMLPARKVGDSGSRYILVSPDDIVFVFVGSALRNGLIPEQGVPSVAFRQDRLYLCTNKGIYSSSYRSLAALCDRIGPALFLCIQRSLAINIRAVREIDFREKQIGIAVTNGSLLWLNVSRRHIKIFRQRLFFPGEERRKNTKDR